MWKTEERKPFPSTFTATGRVEQGILQTNHEGHLAFKAYKWDSSIAIAQLLLWDKPMSVTSMQMQSWAQGDRFTSFFPNVWAYEIISSFHLLARVEFIKWPPATVLIYKAKRGAGWTFSPFSLQRGVFGLHPASCSYTHWHWEASPEDLGQKCLASDPSSGRSALEGIYNSFSSLVPPLCWSQAIK